MAELPVTVVECDGGCDKELNLLNPYLTVTVKPKREVLLLDELPADDPNFVSEDVIRLGTKSGRGVILRFHDFECALTWFENREGKPARLEFHHEDDIYVPDDNREPEELVADGDMHPAHAAALAEMSAPEEDENA